MYEKTLKSDRIYSGSLLGLRKDQVELSGGVVSSREICEHPGAVAVVAITDNKEIVLIRQFRKPAEQVLIEIPAGLYKPGEDLYLAAKRELLEETGYEAGDMKKVFAAYTTPGYSTEVLHYFVATKLTKKAQQTEEDEQIEVDHYPVKDAFEMVKAGQIKDNKTVVGITIAQWTI